MTRYGRHEAREAHVLTAAFETPNITVAFVSHNHVQAKAAFNSFCRSYGALKVPLVAVNQDKMEIKLENGSSIHFFAASRQEDRLRGLHVDLHGPESLYPARWL